MEYFRSLGTSLLQQSGVVLPFALGDKVQAYENEGTIWSLYDGVKRDDGSLISVFVFDASIPYAGRADRRAYLPVAKNALKKIRSTRHPDILKFVDAHETESVIHIATERVRPISTILAQTSPPPEIDYLIWGLHRVTRALAFLNSQAMAIHGLAHRTSSIFATPSGEWRLGGLDLLSSTREAEREAGVIWTMGTLLLGREEGISPEVRKAGWGVLKESDPTSNDAYSLGLLIHAIFNPAHGLPATVQPPHPAPQPSSRGAIPPALFPAFKKLLNPSPKSRLTAAGLLQEGGGLGEGRQGIFGSNRFIWVGDGLEGWGLKGEAERSEILRAIQPPAPVFPAAFQTHKILPMLLHSLSLPSSAVSATSSPSQLLPLVIAFGKLVPPEDYTKRVLNPVVALFKSPDRGTRMALLEGLVELEPFMDEKCVREHVWPHLITGFNDTVPLIREATVKAMPLIAPKLSERLMNNDLLRLLAKSQLDPEPSIRTNTCILIGRMAKHLGPNTKRKVLVPAFGRALKDTFVHARVAGLMAFMATIDVYERDDLASKVIPSVSAALVDREKLVRDQAFIAINLFIKRVEDMVASMPASVEVAPAPSASGSNLPSLAATAAAPTTQAQAGSASSVGGQVISSAGGAAGALAGWAFASINKQLATSDLQTEMATSPPLPGAFSPAIPVTRPSSTSSAPAVPSSSSSRPKGSASASSGMKLSSGGRSLGGSAKKSALDDILGDEDGIADAWGDDAGIGGDLMDVNDDADDWGGFEEAPTPLYPAPAPAPPPPTSRPAPTPAARSPWDDLAPPIPVQTKPSNGAVPKHKVKPSSAALASLPAVSAPVSPAEPSPQVSLSGLSKEDKEKEMTRRREERKARIAALKGEK